MKSISPRVVAVDTPSAAIEEDAVVIACTLGADIGMSSSKGVIVAEHGGILAATSIGVSS